MDRITAVMSLLEGHADVVMDAVGPLVIPSLTAIRSKFDRRRRGKRGPDRIARRLMGMEAKTAQYVDGAGFVRDVIDRAGHDGVAAAFAAEANLPTPAEIADPAAWVARVLG
jgi:putative hydrolase